MLNSLKLAAAFREAQDKKGVTNAEVAKHFGISSPSVSEWRKYGRIGKDKIESLVQYFLDVVPPEHWGLTLSAQDMRAAAQGPPSEPAGLRAGIDESLLARLTALATPRTAEILVRIAQANSEGRLTDNDLDLLAKIASRFEKA